MAEISIDNDPELKYETENLLGKLIRRYLWLPFITHFPKADRFFAMSSNEADLVQKNVASHKALEIIYSFDGKMNFEKGLWNGFWNYVWQNHQNAKAVRNRLKLVEKELKKILKIISQDMPEIRLLTLGAGSARAIIRSIKTIQPEISHLKLKIVAIDKNPEAIKDSQKLAQEYKVEHLFSWINEEVNNLDKFLADYKPNIIEMIGLLDYFSDEEAINLFKTIYNLLPLGGYFFTCNIKNNIERNLVSKVVGWPLIYRDEEELINIMSQSGFKNNNIKIISEPLNIHLVVIAKK